MTARDVGDDVGQVVTGIAGLPLVVLAWAAIPLTVITLVAMLRKALRPRASNK